MISYVVSLIKSLYLSARSINLWIIPLSYIALSIYFFNKSSFIESESNERVEQIILTLILQSNT